MQKKIFYLTLIFLLLLLNNVKAIELDSVKKLFSIISIEAKSYNIYSNESIQLFGAKAKNFVSDNFYWGPAGFAAISGKRSGYLEGGLILGFQFGEKLILDCQLFSGAGGGGAAPQGGGLIINPSLGLSYYLNNNLSIGTNIGYIHFLNGDISSITFGLNIGLNIWNIIYEN